MIHRSKRRDANEAEIVKALRAIGCTVQPLDQGGGVPDLLVGRSGVTLLLEVKDPDWKGGAKPGGKRTKGRGALTPQQVEWFSAWRGGRVIEVVSVEEAIAAVETLAPEPPPVIGYAVGVSADGAGVLVTGESAHRTPAHFRALEAQLDDIERRAKGHR